MFALWVLGMPVHYKFTIDAGYPNGIACVVAFLWPVIAAAALVGAAVQATRDLVRREG